MSREEIVSMLDGLGIPAVHAAWRQGSAPHLPWAVLLMEEDAHLTADGRRWASFPRMRVELYQESSDSELEGSLEAALAGRYGDYEKTEAWVDSEDCLMCSYEFTDI
ncbi:hypothetical protein [Adlercreutzia caecimuris]|uniref:hypothetical protein n=1 Tax=Adlercreutzia caecimuris TaxID=671266 RepID=UPI00258C130D|nr:hypothetical protein [Adlercreutzia caecimuris]